MEYKKWEQNYTKKKRREKKVLEDLKIEKSNDDLKVIFSHITHQQSLQP